MKSTFLLAITSILFFAVNQVSAQNTYVPDNNFEQALIDLGYDSGELNDSVPTANIDTIKTLVIQGKNIENLTGIEAFTSLQNLICYNNLLANLDVSNNVKLKYLNCYYNELTSIDLSNNPLLEVFGCRYNQITNLDLSLNPNLGYVVCSNNQLTWLNVKNGNSTQLILEAINNPDLLCIQVDNPEASYSDSRWLKDGHSIYSIDCSHYEKTYVPDDDFEQALIDLGYDSGTLDDSVSTELLKNITSLKITDKNIIDLTGIEDFSALEVLDCAYNKISEINLSANTNLRILYCQNNNIIELDLSSNHLLTSLIASDNKLSGLNLQNGNNANMIVFVQNNTDLLCIQVDDPVASYENINWRKNAYAGYSEDCSNYVPEMTYVPDDNFEQALINLKLDFDNIPNDSIPTLAIKDLKTLDIHNEQISNLIGIEDFSEIQQLNCNGNQISELNFNKNQNLKNLQCRYNNITELDLSTNDLLEYLDCGFNNLITLDLSLNSSLRTLDAYNNQLTDLNINNGNNENMNISVLKNPDLLCIQVDDAEASYEYSNWYKQPYTAYSEECSSFVPKKTYVPDDNFEQYLIDIGHDYGQLDDSVITYSLKNVISLYINNKNINDLTGIEQCVKLQTLECFDNNLQTLDLSHCLDLDYLDCHYCKLTGLDLSSNTKLRYLNCRLNDLKDLDLSYNSNLQYILCSDNMLTRLNIQNGNNEEISILDAQRNLPLCILVDDITTAANKSSWYIDNWANYNEDCSNHVVEMVYLPDDNFEQALIDLGYDSGSLNDSVSKTIVKNIINLQISNKGIKSLQGIEEFSSLESLECSYNQITNIDLSLNTNLSGLSCVSNLIDTLDLSNNNKLTSLNCSNNQIIYLNLQSCTDLSNLNCSQNNIENLNLTGLIKLKNLRCYKNDLVHLVLRNNTLLDYLDCTNNQLVELDLSSNNKLTYFNCYDNRLTSLNLKNGNNNIIQINTRNNPNLFCIQVDDPAASESYSKWYKDEWTTYSDDCSNTFAMTYVPDDNFEQALIDLGYDSGELNDSVLTKNIKSVINLNIANKNISSLTGIEDFESLTSLTCSLNQLNKLNLNKNEKLDFLECGSNNLDSLNVDSLNLTHISCSYNNLSELKIKNSTDLIYLYCPFNSLKTIDLSNNKLLKELTISSNKLIELDLSLHTDLSKVFLFDNELTMLNLQNGSNQSISNLDISNNPNLFCIQIDNVQEANSFIGWSKDNWASYSEDCSFSGAGIPVSEYNALVDFYNSTNGNKWNLNTNWLDTTSHSVADWFGITVKNGHVDKIVLDSNNVYGYIPNTIGNLSYLEMMALTNNRIYGEIPVTIGDLQNLKVLSFDENDLSGGVPNSITELVNLNYLGLGSNNLEGEIPENIGNLLDLEWLSFHRNNLTGNIPESIGTLLKLRHLYLNNNQFTGTIPESIGNLINLRALELSSNQLNGPVPLDFENLESLYLLNIDNNLFGMPATQNSSPLKSISYEYNRQIPDELASLLQMDTLHLEGNQLQFNDIEAIFSWGNYDDFNEFVYSPQDSIGMNKTVAAFINQNVTLDFDNYYPGASDRYQWYKNGSLLPGKTNAQLTISNLKLTDSGNYTCKITNQVATDLSLYSRSIYVQVSEEIKGAGIPFSEYNTLVEIYNSSNGPHWINSENWLDTIFHSVNDWYGITVENGHVTRFEMPGNNLSQVPNALNNLEKLKIINLESGEFAGDIPNLENLAELDSFSLAGNNFTFKNLTPVTQWKNYDGFENKFNYSNQASVGTPDTLYFLLNDTIKIEVENYYSDNHDNFVWYKNGIPVQNSSNSSFSKTAYFDDNHAEFYCTITNSQLPDLTLTSAKIKTEVYYSQSDSLLLTQLKDEYPGLQTFWTNDTILKWPGITFKNGKVTALDVSGLNLFGNVSSLFLQFDSLIWLDLSENNFTGEFPLPVAGNSNQKSIAINSSDLSFLNISGNRYKFTDLEPASSGLNSISEFIYSPQQIIGQPFDTTILKYQDMVFDIKNFTAGVYDKFSWFKNGEQIPNTNAPTYSLLNVALSDSGYYTCRVTNSLFPELTLYSDTSWLHVQIPVGIEEFTDQKISIYPNPASHRIYIEISNQNAEIKIFNISGILVFEKNDLSSGWFDIQSFNPGVYLFRIRKINDEIITRKVIIK